jgi:hypothetical protein
VFATLEFALGEETSNHIAGDFDMDIDLTMSFYATNDFEAFKNCAFPTAQKGIPDPMKEGEKWDTLVASKTRSFSMNCDTDPFRVSHDD